METTCCRQSALCALLFSKGHYLYRMSSTQKQIHLLLWVRGLSHPCSTETLLANFIFASSFHFIRPKLATAWQWELAHPAKKHVLGPGSAVGLLGQGCLRNTDQVITIPPSDASTLEIQLLLFSYWMTHWYWSKGWEEGCQHAPKLREARLPCKVWVVRAVKTTRCWPTTSCTLLQTAW